MFTAFLPGWLAAWLALRASEPARPALLPPRTPDRLSAAREDLAAARDNLRAARSAIEESRARTDTGPMRATGQNHGP
ncbi:hypothetical protein H5395_08135 [Paracoccus sp. MC1854]|uniref:hypothetical protein n=1 Tax=Paracoccus sp. MC1854 TaxID=2760306 RepID=UPI001601594F|nr:hypothetical protein [Paracoccus sp. MC1854]MBB1491500.1 hypothetical protein [Paracoccus sp. MC1854]